MITVQHNGIFNEYYGLSTDTKPVADGLNGSTFYEIDTRDLYMYNEDGNTGEEWVKQGA